MRKSRPRAAETETEYHYITFDYLWPVDQPTKETVFGTTETEI